MSDPDDGYDGFCADCDMPIEQCDCTFLDFVCGMMADGSCSLAGTETCDWECPRTRAHSALPPRLIEEPSGDTASLSNGGQPDTNKSEIVP